MVIKVHWKVAMKTPDKPQTATKLRLPDGSVIDAEVLDQEDREAYIEFAIHLAAPKLAKLLAGELSSVKQRDKTVLSQKYDDLYFNLPVTLTVKEAAEFLRCSTYKIYEMCRIYQGRFFPHVRLGSRVVIPRAGFIQFIEAGGLEGYRKKIEDADVERKRQEEKRRSRGAPP